MLETSGATLKISGPNTGKKLLLRVRTGFVAQGSSLNAWCRANGIFTQNARMALLGRWKDPAGKALVIRLIKQSERDPE
jgi:hypothetical protein